MKSIRLLAIALLAAFALVSCDSNDGVPDMGKGSAVQFTTTISKMATRASGTAWGGTDQIGVFMLSTGGTIPNDISIVGGTAADNVKYTNPASGFTSTTPIYYPQSGNVDFVAYYPWRTAPGTTPYIYKVDVNNQTTPANIDLLWSNNAINKVRSTTAVDLEFKHKLSQVVLNIKAGTGMAAADLAGITAKITDMPTKADFVLADGSFSNEGTVADIVPIVATTTAGYVATYTAIVVPQAASVWSGRTMVFTVGGVDYTCAIPDVDDFATGRSYPYEILVNEKGVTVSRGDITDWTTPPPEDLGEVAQIPIPQTAKIPAGTFFMGSSDGSGNNEMNPSPAEPNRSTNEIQHKVTLTKDFYMSKYQVTNTQYVAFLNAKSVANDGKLNGVELVQDCSLGGRNPWGVKWDTDKWIVVDATHANHPVIYVTWHGAVAYCAWLSEQTGGTWRLPTEAQWEYACRGDYANKDTETATLPFGIGDGRKLVSGMANYYVQYSYDLDHIPPGQYDVGNNTGYLGQTNSVGSYTPNNYGLYDMHGNVWEWCSDWYGSYGSGAVTDPTGLATGSIRVLRGGSWNDPAQGCRSAYRYSDSPDNAGNNIGFRVVFVP